MGEYNLPSSSFDCSIAIHVTFELPSSRDMSVSVNHLRYMEITGDREIPFFIKAIKVITIIRFWSTKASRRAVHRWFEILDFYQIAEGLEKG